MSKPNYKLKELKEFAEIILSQSDTRKIKECMNGKILGISNRYKIEGMSPTKQRRIELWREILTAYK